MPRSTTNPNRATKHQTGNQAVFLRRDGKNEIGVGVGEHLLQGALARASAEPTAFDEGLQRPIELIGIPGARIEKPIDPVC